MADLLLFDPAFFDPAIFDTTGPDSSDLDTALMAKLQADLTLQQWMPNGVYWDEAPPNATRFVIVSLVDEHDEGVFGGRAIEDHLYLVKAVGFQVAAPIMQRAAEQIDALLEDQPLTVLGYTHMTTHREERVRFTEVDESNPDARWQHRGGRYRVQVSL